jgi:arylsulfatase A-like enzyme
LFQALKDLGYYDDSVVVLLADHGHPLGDHGKFLKGGDRMYNELLRVPFLIRLPGGAGARRTRAIVQFHDLLPTLLDLLGMANNVTSMQGRSFRPVLSGDTDTHRQTIITGYHEAVDRCVRDETWSYIQRPEGEPDELYNLAEDPKEHTNLIDRYPEEARRLAQTFGSYFYRSNAQTAVKGIQGKYELASGSIE